jgi:ribosomal protein S18 acetylase RimI-like enzyme
MGSASVGTVVKSLLCSRNAAPVKNELGGSKMATISTRCATQADLPLLLEFEQGVIKAERPFTDNLKDGHITYYDLEQLISSDSAQLLVAEVDGVPAGSGYAAIRQSRPYQKRSSHAYLGFMYVEPRFRGRGINKQVIAALEAWSRSRGVYELVLDVYDENAPAIRAYEKTGFRRSLLEMRMTLDK